MGRSRVFLDILKTQELLGKDPGTWHRVLALSGVLDSDFLRKDEGSCAVGLDPRAKHRIPSSGLLS